VVLKYEWDNKHSRISQCFTMAWYEALMSNPAQAELSKDDSIEAWKFDGRMELDFFDQMMYIDGRASAKPTLKEPSSQP
jgi:hypothetical protein